MKSAVLTIVITLVLVTAIGIYTNIHTNDIVQTYLSKAADIEALVRQGELSQAQKAAHALKEAWHKECESFQYIAFHQDTNEVDATLHKMDAGFVTDNLALIHLALNELVVNFENLSQREEIAWVNIF